MLIKTALTRLYEKQPLTHDESHTLFSALIAGNVSNEVLAAALMCMKMRGEHVAEISGAAQAFIHSCVPFERPDYVFGDIVGTGGDGQNTLNISTAAALVVASCGYAIAKHGNRAVSSLSGSSDVLVKLGIDLELTPQQSRALLDQHGLCFLMAPNYHQGFRYAAPVRQQLKTRTIFNVLGPLINPARPPVTLIGVYDESLVLPIAHVLKALGFQRAAVVHGAGTDEVALHGKTFVAELDHEEITNYILEASDFGLPVYELSQIKGGIPEYNHQALLNLLSGPDKANAAYAATVAANSALLLKLFGQNDLKANAQQALHAIYSGNAKNTLNNIVDFCQTCQPANQMTSGASYATHCA